MNSSKVLLGVLGGVAAGAVVGILFAPAKGKKTRKRILNTSKDYAGELKNKFNGIIENVTDTYENILIDTQEFINKNEVKK